MKLPLICIACSCFLLLTSCAGEKKQEKKGPGVYEEKKEKTITKSEVAVEVPVMLDNKGIGPVKTITFSDEIDQDLANRGAALFKAKCMACHKAEQKFIGPPMAGIYKKRSPEWVMNIIMNPDEMLEKDPVAKALLKEYNNTRMLNQNIPQDEARAMVEWFRTLD